MSCPSSSTLTLALSSMATAFPSASASSSSPLNRLSPSFLSLPSLHITYSPSLSPSSSSSSSPLLTTAPPTRTPTPTPAHPPRHSFTPLTFPHSSCSTLTTTTPASTRCWPRRFVSCDVALRSSNNSATSLHNDPSLSTSSSSSSQDPQLKVGARVRVKVPLQVYHVPRLPQLDLTGTEGRIKQYVAVWNGKPISANLPYKVEFLVDVEGRGPVKFFAHLREDEFEYLD